jgi:hypothetical protein
MTKILFFIFTNGCKNERAWIILTHFIVLQFLTMGGFVNIIKNKNDYKSWTCGREGGGCHI